MHYTRSRQFREARGCRHRGSVQRIGVVEQAVTNATARGLAGSQARLMADISRFWQITYEAVALLG